MIPTNQFCVSQTFREVQRRLLLIAIRIRAFSFP